MNSLIYFDFLFGGFNGLTINSLTFNILKLLSS